MRLAILLLMTLAFTPAALARPDLPDLSEPITVGPCTAGWSPYWPGETVGARCDDPNGNPLVAFSQGTCALGQYVYVYAAGATILVPCSLW